MSASDVLTKLREYGILDPPLPEQAYDDLTALAACICQTPIALLSLIDTDRQWFKSNRGLDGVESTPRAHAFCAHAIAEAQPLIVNDATRDRRFEHNPLVTGAPYIRFYAGVPLVAPTGEALGTLCVIDRQSRELRPEQIEALRALSRQAISQRELRHTIQALERRVLGQDARVQKLTGRPVAAARAATEPVTLSFTDRLTSIGNRHAFDRRLADDVNHTKRYATPLSLLMVDIDHFRLLNDRFGEQVGDRSLVNVARLLQQSARVTDFVARYGGEEFAVLLPHTSREGAVVLAERFRRAVERAVWKDSPVTVSLGVATYAPGGPPAETLAADADRAVGGQTAWPQPGVARRRPGARRVIA